MSLRKLTDLVQWQEMPPALNVLRAPILSPRPTTSVRTIIVCDEHVVVPTHYIRQRTTACVGRENRCEGCLALSRTIWKAYFGVWWPEQDRCWLAELTHRAFESVQAIVEQRKGRLRGWVLLQSRPKPHKQARVYATLRPPTPEESRERLPAAFNLKESLAQVWVNLIDLLGPPVSNYPEEEIPG